MIPSVDIQKNLSYSPINFDLSLSPIKNLAPAPIKRVLDHTLQPKLLPRNIKPKKLKATQYL